VKTVPLPNVAKSQETFATRKMPFGLHAERLASQALAGQRIGLARNSGSARPRNVRGVGNLASPLASVASRACRATRRTSLKHTAPTILKIHGWNGSVIGGSRNEFAAAYEPLLPLKVLWLILIANVGCDKSFAKGYQPSTSFILNFKIQSISEEATVDFVLSVVGLAALITYSVCRSFGLVFFGLFSGG
jgi:hypothetical protein